MSHRIVHSLCCYYYYYYPTNNGYSPSESCLAGCSQIMLHSWYHEEGKQPGANLCSTAVMYTYLCPAAVMFTNLCSAAVMYINELYLCLPFPQSFPLRYILNPELHSKVLVTRSVNCVRSVSLEQPQYCSCYRHAVCTAFGCVRDLPCTEITGFGA